MNNERVEYLLAYLSELTKLTTNEYRCNTEIAECIGWIREELQKDTDKITTITFNGEVIARG